MSLAEQLFKGCKSPAQFYKALILADRFLVPSQLDEVFQGCEPFLSGAPPDVYKILKKTHAQLRMRGDAIKPYKRYMLTQNVAFFEAVPTPGATLVDSRKRLLICFAGNAGRLMLPTSVLLQQLPLQNIDVAMLGDPSGLGFLRGVVGYGDNLQRCMQRLLSDLARTSYAGTYCLGTSAGGAAALYAGVLINAQAALSIGGHHPSMARKRRERAEALGITGMEFDALVERSASSATRPTRLGAMFAELHETDRLGSQALADKLPGCALIKVQGMNVHNLMNHLSDAGDLPRVLSQRLFGELDD